MKCSPCAPASLPNNVLKSVLRKTTHVYEKCLYIILSNLFKIFLGRSSSLELISSVIDLTIQKLFICMICLSLATIQGNFPLPACGFQGNAKEWICVGGIKPTRNLVPLEGFTSVPGTLSHHFLGL